jgi:hypothetical protein
MNQEAPAVTLSHPSESAFDTKHGETIFRDRSSPAIAGRGAATEGVVMVS